MTEMLRVPVGSEQATESLGQRLAAVLVPGTVIGLVGTLGAGKTRFVQAIASALGVPREDVTSPTFVLCNEYQGRIPIYHFDAYRIGDIEEFRALGAMEYFASSGITIVEWSDRVADAMPADMLCVKISIVSDHQRVFAFDPTGMRSAEVVRLLESLVG